MQNLSQHIPNTYLKTVHTLGVSVEIELKIDLQGCNLVNKLDLFKSCTT